MAGFLYPRTLLESWFRLRNKTPKLEAIGDWSDDSSDEDSFEQMGRYDNIADYDDDETAETDNAGVRTVNSSELNGPANEDDVDSIDNGAEKVAGKKPYGTFDDT